MDLSGAEWVSGRPMGFRDSGSLTRGDRRSYMGRWKDVLTMIMGKWKGILITDDVFSRVCGQEREELNYKEEGQGI